MPLLMYIADQVNIGPIKIQILDTDYIACKIKGKLQKWPKSDLCNLSLA
jgi:hypothetical protein